MTELIIDNRLTEDELEKWLTNQNNEIKAKVNQQINMIFDEISKLQIQTDSTLYGIMNKTKEIHKKLRYSG